MHLLPGDVISDSIAFTGIYELPLSRELCGLAKQGGQLVDVGANLGYFSLLWAAARPDNSVIAFEASPRTVELLRLNVAKNQYMDRIVVRAEAVGKQTGEMEFEPGPDDQTGWGGFSLQSSKHSLRVPVIRLDDVLDDSKEVSLLKIDVEGADTWVIYGAERLLRGRRIRHVWWEENKPRMRMLGIREREAAEFLGNFGYHAVTKGDPHADTVSWFATCR